MFGSFDSRTNSDKKAKIKSIFSSQSIRAGNLSGCAIYQSVNNDDNISDKGSLKQSVIVGNASGCTIVQNYKKGSDYN
jgi:hypothetical protein